MMIEILHMTSGQTVVGECTEGRVCDPFEVFITPSAAASSGAAQITMSPYGSLFGLLPAVASFRIDSHTVVARVNAPQDFADHYTRCRQQHIDALNQITAN